MVEEDLICTAISEICVHNPSHLPINDGIYIILFIIPLIIIIFISFCVFPGGNSVSCTNSSDPQIPEKSKVNSDPMPPPMVLRSSKFYIILA